MGYENDPYRDEDGEPLMDFDDDDVRSDNEQQGVDDNLLDDNLDDEEDEGWRRERSPTPVHDESKSKPRKRLVKKAAVDNSGPDDFQLRDEDDGEDDDVGGYLKDDSDGGGPSSSGGKRKRLGKESVGSDRGRLKKKREGKEGKKLKVRKLGYSSADKLRDHEKDPEMKEMWDTVAGGDSEDDKEGARTMDDENFIDDSGLDPADRYEGEEHYPRSPGDAPQAEEGEEDEDIKQLFKSGKKKKKHEKSAGEIAILVENVMAELEVVAEEDAELNRQNKPAINKLKKLPLLTEVLSKKQLQQEFLDHGVLTLLKNWLEPLPDGSLPNINIRAAILKILSDYPIDLEQHDRREQLKKSNLGKVIMFLSKSDEETTSNRKLAKDLVDKWSRPIFNKSTRFEDMRNYEDERAPYRRPTVRRPVNKDVGMDSRDDDLDLGESSKRAKSSQSSDRLHASRPEALAMDFVVRPQSKIDPEEIRARAKQIVLDQRPSEDEQEVAAIKKHQKKKQLQATKLSIEGRGMVKYL